MKDALSDTRNLFYEQVSLWSCYGVCVCVCCRPLDVKRTDKAITKTTARYPIRSGPKQFAAYLSGTFQTIATNGRVLAYYRQ